MQLDNASRRVGAGSRFVHADVPIPAQSDNGEVESTVANQPIESLALLLQGHCLHVEGVQRPGRGREALEERVLEHLVAAAGIAGGEEELVEQEHLCSFQSSARGREFGVDGLRRTPGRKTQAHAAGAREKRNEMGPDHRSPLVGREDL